MSARHQRLRLAFPLVAALAVAAVPAHDGEVHDTAVDATAAPTVEGRERPRLLPDGSLQVGLPLQRLLQLDTTAWSASDARLDGPTLAAEVLGRADAALAVLAPERGRLDAPDGGWPLAGQPVAAGQVLGWLRPQLSQQERAERRARIARMDAELTIVDVNVERQQLQSAVNSDTGGVASGNIWAEKYLAERDALRSNRDLLVQSLDDRIALRAPRAGRVLAVAATPGMVVEAGTAVLRLSDPRSTQLVALHQQAGLGSRIVSARLADGRPLALAAEEPLADGSGWRLRFDAAGDGRALRIGEVVRVQVRVQPAAGALALPPGACVRLRDGAEFWVHRAPDRYERRLLPSCQPGAGASAALADGDRIVTTGAALLSRYR